MNGFHAVCLGMSSQFPTKTSRKKTANVMVGNSMRSPALQSRERDGRPPAGVRARDVTTPARAATSRIMTP